jgi:hypothetical protein
MLFQPRYGPTLYPDAKDSFYRASAWRDLSPLKLYDGAQSIAYCFNMAFATALDARDDGVVCGDGQTRHATHFAMLHADIKAQDGWLDVLYGLMTTHDLTAISVVIPIKEPTRDPRTSTAIGKIADSWTPDRFVMMSDRGKWATTFTASDVPGLDLASEELLINTGCLLIDLRDVVLWDAFEAPRPNGDSGWMLDSRIDRTPVGRRVAMRSEDWQFSRFLRAHGARYGATWDVTCFHFGDAVWSNNPPAAS